jgi:hypothetical protein
MLGIGENSHQMIGGVLEVVNWSRGSDARPHTRDLKIGIVQR